MTDKCKDLVRNLLLAFVFVSVGFVLGKHRGRHAAETSPGTTTQAATYYDNAATPIRVRVYYLHATSRCVTCNTLEKMTRNVLDEQFTDALANGQLEWEVDDYQRDESLAARFDVIASGVIVARMQGETALEFKRLDDVWTLMGTPAEFNEYVGSAIRAYLSARTEDAAR